MRSIAPGSVQAVAAFVEAVLHREIRSPLALALAPSTIVRRLEPMTSQQRCHPEALVDHMIGECRHAPLRARGRGAPLIARDPIEPVAELTQALQHQRDRISHFAVIPPEGLRR
jgi:hypothetical protein